MLRATPVAGAEVAKPAEERLAEVPSNMLLPSKKDLELAASKVSDWIQHAEGDDLKLMVDALQLEISMDNKQGKMSGVIPDYTGANSHANVRAMVRVRIQTGVLSTATLHESNMIFH